MAETIEERFPVGSRWERHGTIVRVTGHGHYLSGTPRIELAHEDGSEDGCQKEYLLNSKRLDDAPAPKPAPMCEAVGFDGPAHALAVDAYGLCRVCKCTASERRAARRRRFDFNVDCAFFVFSECAEESEWWALVGSHPLWDVDRGWLARAYGQHVLAPTREIAMELLFEKLEAAR